MSARSHQAGDGDVDNKLKSISESLSKLSTITRDNSAFIYTWNMELTFDLNMHTNFEDRTAFGLCASRFLMEATTLNIFNDIVTTGYNKYISMFYTWRSISRSIPNQPEGVNKNEMNLIVQDIFNEEMKVLYEFKDWVLEHAIPSFCDNFSSSMKTLDNKEVLSQAILLSFANSVDTFLVLDVLKDTKVTIKNDHTGFKRYGQMISDKNLLSPLLRDETKVTDMTMFLAQTRNIMSTLKTKLETIPNYHIIVVKIINEICSLLEKGAFLNPTEKYKLLRSISGCLILIDSPTVPLLKMEKKKDFSFLRIERLIKDYYVLPIIGDMHVPLKSFFQRITHIDLLSVLNLNDSAYLKSLDAKYNICNFVDSIRDAHIKTIADLSLTQLTILNKHVVDDGVIMGLSDSSLTPKDTWTFEESQSVFYTVLNSFLHLSRLTEYVQTYFSWKMVNPAKTCRESEGSVATVDAYEALTQFNYNNEEKRAMVRAITYMKTLHNSLVGLESIIMPALSKFFYTVFQKFVNEMTPLVAKIKKSSKLDYYRVIISGMQVACQDMMCTFKNQSDSKKSSGTRHTSDSIIPDGEMKSVFPLSTQIYVFQTTVDILLRSPDTKKLIDNNKANQMIEFITLLTNLKPFLNYGQTLRECCDLGSFLYREFYLEINKHIIQYPIETSPPWIFASHIIDSSDPSLTESLLFVLDCYNDSAHSALTVLKRRYVWDEIEAEANIVCDHLVHKLAEKVYSHYRMTASSIYFHKSYKGEISRLLNKVHAQKRGSEYMVNFAQGNKYDGLISQKAVQLLGRQVNLSHLIAEKMISSLQTSLEIALCVYESTGLHNIHEMHYLLEITRITHSLLAEHLTLPPFKILFEQVNNNVTSSMSRIAIHTLWDLVNNVAPNYAFSSILMRFVPSKVSYTTEAPRQKYPQSNAVHFFGSKNLAKAYSSIVKSHCDFIGQQHLCLLLDYVGNSGLSLILEHITRFASLLICEKLAPYVQVMREGLPKKISMPRFHYGLLGTIKVYTMHFESIFKYKELYPGVFQRMREIGNCFAIVHQLEMAMKNVNMFSQINSSVFQGVSPNAPSFNYYALNPLIQLPYMQLIHRSLPDDGAKASEKVSLLNMESLTEGLSIFDHMLLTIKASLVGEPWEVQVPPNGTIFIDECKEFYRIYSALCVAMVHTIPPNESSIEQIFGDSLFWCGEGLTMLLGQSYLSEALDFIAHAVKIAEYEDATLNIVVSASNSSAPPVKSKKSNLDSPARVKIFPKMKALLIKKRVIKTFFTRFYRSSYYSTNKEIRIFLPPKFSS